MSEPNDIQVLAARHGARIRIMSSMEVDWLRERATALIGSLGISDKPYEDTTSVAVFVVNSGAGYAEI